MTTGEAPPSTPRTQTPVPPAVAGGDPPGSAAASIKQSAVRGVGWTSFIHAYRIGVGLLTTCVLAYLLGREAFGLVGSATVIVGFLMLLKDLGTGAAIVQSKSLADDTVCSIFWTNVLLGVTGSLALFAAAPAIAWVLATPELEPIVQALSAMMLLAGLGTTHQSLLQRELRFARLARIELVGITAGAVVGIGSALLGAGVWALVFQALAAMALTTALAVVLQGWRPRRVLRLADVRGVARFSLNLTGFNVLNYVTKSADQLLVLRCLGQAEAGLYYLAVKLLLFPLSTINSVLSRVLFPLFARIQDDDDRLRNAFLKVTTTIALLVLPFVIGFAVLAEPIVAGILPPKWLPVVPLVAALAVVAVMQSLTTSVGNLYLAKGRTDLLVLWGLGTCAACVTAFAIGTRFGTIGVARAYAAVAVVLFVPALWIPLRLIDTSLRQFAAAVWRPTVAAVAMGLLVAGTGYLFEASPLVDLAVRVPLGVLSYAGLGLWLNREHVDQLLALLRRREAAG